MSNKSSASEVVIVGGGIYGTSLAYEMAKLGKSVTLLEAGEIACGASGGPGERGVRANHRDVRELPVVSIAIDRWAAYQEEFEGGVGYRRLGGILVYDVPYGAREHEVVGKMESLATVQSALGVPSELLSRDEILEREPELSPSIQGAVFCPKDGVGDHTYATQQFAKMAEKLGVVIRTGARVTEIIHEKGDATGVRLEDGEVVPVGGQLALMNNGGVQPLIKPFLTPNDVMPVWVMMPQMMYVDNPEGRTINHLLSHNSRRLAIKQLPDKTVMLSGGVSVAHTDNKLWQASLSSTAINLTDSISTFPFLDRSSFTKVDASRVESVAVDGIPIIGKPEGLANTIYAYAWSGHGYAISLGFTKLFVDWLTTGKKPELLMPFSPHRFTSPGQALAGSGKSAELALSA